MRTYADPVEVRTETGEDEAPAAFLWRGRLYVVRDVLGHWRERRSWWSSPAARMVHGEGRAPEAEPAASSVAAGVRVAELAEEQEVWRVSASRGRSYAEGVFDLCREPAAGGVPASTEITEITEITEESRDGSPGVWRLVHVAD